MKNAPSLRNIRHQKNRFLACTDMESICKLLRLSSRKIQLLQKQNTYTIFTIPKKDGSLRIIENPSDFLKDLQRKLNNYLQAVYYFIKHPSSYGFCIQAKNETNPCTIYTNALRHKSCNYLLNVDIRDFFHGISWQSIFDLFSQAPFHFNFEARVWLCNHITNNQRLPMGAPTSPVVSNLVATSMDIAMEQLAKRNNCIYTRFADDLSFSSDCLYSPTFKEEVLQTIKEFGLEVNTNKIKEYGLNDIKVITGLCVGETVTLSKTYWQKVEMLIDQLTALECLIQTRPSITVFNQAEDIKEKINGFLSFAKMIGRSEKENIKKMEDKLGSIENTLEDFESITWNEIPYQFI